MGTKENGDNEKIWDTFYGSGLIFSGLGILLVAILNPSMWIENLSIGIPCVIIGAIRVMSWKKYYDYRITMLNSNMRLIVCIFLISTAFFLIPFEYIQEKVRLYLLSTIIMILLIVISVEKRNQLSDMHR